MPYARDKLATVKAGVLAAGGTHRHTPGRQEVKMCSNASALHKPGTVTRVPPVDIHPGP